jgi:hypothetical protein
MLAALMTSDAVLVFFRRKLSSSLNRGGNGAGRSRELEAHETKV